MTRQEQCMVALAKATATAQERRRSEREALIEDVEWLLVTERPERIAERLDSTVAAIARRLYRAGRPDLAVPFARLDKAMRSAA